jgi:hypothetical protein
MPINIIRLWDLLLVLYCIMKLVCCHVGTVPYGKCFVATGGLRRGNNVDTLAAETAFLAALRIIL